jgi:hypothetical protein
VRLSANALQLPATTWTISVSEWRDVVRRHHTRSLLRETAGMASNTIYWPLMLQLRHEGDRRPTRQVSSLD